MIMSRFLISISFAILMAISSIVMGTLGAKWGFPLFIFGVAGFLVSFISWRQAQNKLFAYWKKCHVMSGELGEEMLRCIRQEDFESAKGFDRRTKRVLELWSKSIETKTIPEGPDLEDL